MDSFQVIPFQRQRDFSNKMNATIEFIKQNFSPLFKSILFIAGPPVLLSSLLIGSFIGELFGIQQSVINDPTSVQSYFTSASFWIPLLLFFVFAFISGVITLATIYNFIILYDEKKSNEIEVSEVWERVRQTFWKYAVSILLFSLLAIGVYVALILVMFIFSTISQGLIFLGALGMIVAMFYLIFSSSLTFIIVAFEKKEFFSALARSFYLVRGKWWSTFGLIFILYMIMGIVSYIPMIPFYVILFTQSLHSVETQSIADPTATLGVWTTVFFTLYYLIQMILSTLPHIGIAFQYFNLVEMKEARGLMGEIESMGHGEEERREEHF